MIKKFLINCFLLLFISIFLCTTISYAAVAVTDENLNEALQNFASSDDNEQNYKVSASNNVINIQADDQNYTLNYDLTDQPTFSYEALIKQGMSYDEFSKETDNLVLPMLGYIAVANIQGASVEDATTYFLMSYLSAALNSEQTENSFVIVDDSDPNVTYDKDNSNVIYTSEFGNKVMEYVTNTYPEKQTISDSDLNSYTFTIERLDTTNDSCRLVSTLSVNLDADFSKLNGMADNIASSVNKNITKENADFVVTLKVGQKCKFETNEKISGYEFYGSDCIDISEDKTEITATNVGEKNGYIYVGNEKKSIYITVEENTGNETLEPIVLKINSTVNNDSSNTNNDNNNNNNDNQSTSTDDDNTKAPTKLPNTGLKNATFVIISFGIITIIAGVKLTKYKDIK